MQRHPNRKRQIFGLAAAFCAGAVFYPLLELLWRQRTHWTMAAVGGFCSVLLYEIAGLRLPFFVKCLLGAGGITLTELAAGCVINLLLDWAVWDYSNRLFNVLGQICPLYSALWLLVSVPALLLETAFRRELDYFYEKFPS